MRKSMLTLLVSFAAGCLAPADEAVHDAGIVEDAEASFAPNSQTAYTYPGCADETRSICPWDGTYLCAKAAIARRYAACSAAADCVHVELGNDPITGCPPAAVNSANEAAFRAEMQTEIDRYDAVSDCRSSGQCIGGMTVDCIDGLCAWVYPPDAGL